MEQIAVLLIQRQRLPRKQLRRSLDLDGYYVTAVTSLDDARAQLRDRRYDLVVCTDRDGGRDSHEALIDDSAPLLQTPGLDLYLAGVGSGALIVMREGSRNPSPTRFCPWEQTRRRSFHSRVAVRRGQ